MVKKFLMLVIMSLLILTPHASPLTPHGLWAVVALMGLKPGEPAPDFRINTLDGKEITLNTLKGRIAILAFWKQGQGYSEETLADLERIYQEYGAKGLMILAINADKAPEPEINRMATAHNLNYLLARDDDLKVYGAFGIMVLPTTIVIGPEGKLADYCPIHPRDFYEQIRGQVRLLLGKITPAQLEAELHPQKIPEESEARKKAHRYLNLGRTLLDRGLNDKAKEEFEKAAQADPLFPEPHILLARLYLKDKEISKAIAKVDQVLKLDPAAKEVKLLQGMAYAAQGEDNKALSILEELVKNNPKPPAEAYYQMGKIYHKQNKTQQALEAYRKALELLLEK